MYRFVYFNFLIFLQNHINDWILALYKLALILKRRLDIDLMVPFRKEEKGFSLVEISMILSVLAL